jgi:hypothetical protein
MVTGKINSLSEESQDGMDERVVSAFSLSAYIIVQDLQTLYRL